ncbi:MAG: sulfotransferase domain-containing protein [Chitinophagales bacterium]
MNGIKANISSSRLAMQYIRWLPYQLGFINRAAFLMQIREILSDDIYLVSYPKSGNTWLRYLVAYMITNDDSLITLDQLEYLVPDVYVSKDIIDRKKSGRIIKTHDTFFEDFPRVIYIYRDYRDVILSYFHYQTSLKLFNGSFSEFIRSDQLHTPFGSWKSHVNKALSASVLKPDTFLLLSYESLKNDFENSLRRIADFCSIQLNVPFDLIQKKTNFESLKFLEETHGGWFSRLSNEHFFRKGEIGNWKGNISQSDLEFIYSDDEVVSLLAHLKYEL